MNVTVALILLVAAFVLFLLAGLRVGESKVSLGWLGASCLALAMLLRGGI
jgi:hypothetical protein